MLARFKRYAAEQHLIPEGTTVLLAVSGGRDSVAMVDLFHRAGVPFEIAHCNFNLRPGDCDRDEAFVRQLSDRYGVPCHVARFDTRAYAADNGMSIEEAARHLRYDYFAQLSTLHSPLSTPVATAHHADDSIETFFLNLFRGTGLHGLHGIRPISSLITHHSSLTIIRPLLCFSRADIDAYIAERGLQYVEDYTNAELDARRNRIRHQLMPLLRELYPSVDQTMLANIERLNATEELLDTYIDQLRQQLIKPYTSILPATHYQLPPIEALDLPQLITHHSSFITLFELLRPYGFNAATVADIIQTIKQSVNQSISGRLFYSPTHVAELHRGQLLIAPNSQFSIPNSQFSILNSQFSIRPWRPGDRFRPKGMKGTRLVSDFLKDLHLSRIEKQYVLVRVDADDRILAVVGLRDSALI
ncbi:MAG: tRNA lysidine(34) synthetase TilS [Bacteroidales bacterium]|nr:tRNA lysidine(34) synthetase TilS [Bacteroidales bacterium]